MWPCMWVRISAIGRGPDTSKKVLAERGSQKVDKTGGEKWAECITVSGAGLASGVTVPSYIVYRCKHLYSTWCQSEPASALYGASGSAWMEQTNFLSQFVKILL